MSTLSRVEMECEPSAAFFPFFVLGVSKLGGTDVLAPASVTRSLPGVRRIRVSRGRDYEIDEYRAGTCVVELDDAAREYDPLNTASSFYGSVEPGKTVRAVVAVAGVDYTLFTGYTQRWPRDNQQRIPRATCMAVDGLGILANQDLDAVAASYSGETSGARVRRVLDLPEVSYPTTRDIDDGDSIFGPTTFTEEGGNAARYLQLAAQSEQGALYVTKAGILRFRRRNFVPGSVVATFSDDGDAGSIRYENIGQDFDNTLLYTRVKTSGTSGIVQVVEDATSSLSYQVRTLDRTGQLVLSDAEMASQASFLLERYKAPTYPLREVVVDVSTLPAALQAEVLGLELGDLVIVEHTPYGGGSQVVQTSFVDGLVFDIDAASGRITATVTVSQAAGRISFILGHSTFGVLGTSKLGY